MPRFGPDFLSAFLTTKNLFWVLKLTGRAVIKVIIVHPTRNGLRNLTIPREFSQGPVGHDDLLPRSS